MANYEVGKGKRYASVTEAVTSLPGKLIGQGKPWIELCEQERIPADAECVPFLYRTADGTQYTIFLPKLPDDEQYHYCNGEIWVVPKTGFHNVSAEDYIEVTGMIYEVGRKWRQFWTVQRALDYMPVNLVGTGENRIVCYEPRAWWWQRWLSTVAHWGFVVKRWVQYKPYSTLSPLMKKLSALCGSKAGDSIDVVSGFENEVNKDVS